MPVSGSDTERGYLHGAILIFAGRVQHFPDFFFVPAINQERRVSGMLSNALTHSVCPLAAAGHRGVQPSLLFSFNKVTGAVVVVCHDLVHVYLIFRKVNKY